MFSCRKCVWWCRAKGRPLASCRSSPRGPVLHLHPHAARCHPPLQRGCVSSAHACTHIMLHHWDGWVLSQTLHIRNWKNKTCLRHAPLSYKMHDSSILCNPATGHLKALKVVNSTNYNWQFSKYQSSLPLPPATCPTGGRARPAPPAHRWPGHCAPKRKRPKSLIVSSKKSRSLGKLQVLICVLVIIYSVGLITACVK